MDGLELAGQHPAHLGSQDSTVPHHQGHGAAWIRIGIAGTANHEHRLNGRKLLLNIRLSEAGIIAAQLVIVGAEGRSVNRGAEEHLAQLAVRRVNRAAPAPSGQQDRAD